MPRFKHGWRRDKSDARDRLYRKTIKPTIEALPPAADVADKCPPVYDQSELGSCTANALVCGKEFLDGIAGAAYIALSRLFLYYNERKIEGDVNDDWGAEIRDGIKSMASDGVCPEAEWPYAIDKFAEEPAQNCYADAKQNVIASYHRILTIDDMKTCIAEGFPFVFGFDVYAKFETLAKDDVLNIPGEDEEYLGGHAVVAVGYDDAKQAFKVRNSWGPDWGDAGYFWMSYDYIESSMASDMWTIRQ